MGNRVRRDGTCDKVIVRKKQHKRWKKIKDTLGAMRRKSYPYIDWCSMFQPFDAIGDVPIPQLFPYIYMAHRKAGVKVILTVRNATEWPARRANWEAKREEQIQETVIKL